MPISRRRRPRRPRPRRSFHSPCLCARRPVRCSDLSNGLGFEVRYGNPESSSFLLPGTGKREGGEKTQPFDHFQIRLVTEQGSNSSMFAISYSFILTELSPSLSFISFSPPPPDEGIGGNPRKGWNGVRATSSKIIWARFHVHGSGGNVAHPASDEFRVPVHERMSRGKREFGKRREETGGCHTVNGTEENCEEATEPKYLKSKIKPKVFWPKANRYVLDCIGLRDTMLGRARGS